MNFLGHWLFSDPEPDALMGSLWPDFARRPPQPEVSDNFLVHFDRHQAIDRETDSTPILEPLRVALRPKLRKTTPIVVDMLLDHHLARYWSDFHDEPLPDFTRRRYRLVNRFDDLVLPERLARTLMWMQRDDWLTGYRHPDNVLRALQGLSRRLRFDDPMVQQGAWALQTYRLHQSGVNDYLNFLLDRYH